MKIIQYALIGLAFLLPGGIMAQCANDSLALINAEWNWQKIGKNAQAGYAMIPMFGITQSISVIKYKAKNYKTSFVDCSSPNHNTVPVVAKREDALAAINATYFDVKKLIPSCYFALGGKIVGRTYQNEHFRANGYVALKDKKGRKMEIAYVDTTKYDIYPKQYEALIVSGPVVLQDKNIPVYPKDKSFYKTRHPRTVVGYDDKGYIYYVVIDGRFPANGAIGASIEEVGLIARYLGMTTALNLDGGGSSTIWSEPTGVINHPYDNKKFDHEGCRKVPNIIVMKK